MDKCHLGAAILLFLDNNSFIYHSLLRSVSADRWRVTAIRAGHNRISSLNEILFEKTAEQILLRDLGNATDHTVGVYLWTLKSDAGSGRRFVLFRPKGFETIKP